LVEVKLDAYFEINVLYQKLTDFFPDNPLVFAIYGL